MEKVGLRNNRKDWKPRGQRGTAEGSRLEKTMLKSSIRGEQRMKESGLSLVETAAGPGGGSKGRPLLWMLDPGRQDTGKQGGKQCSLKGRFYSLFSFTPSPFKSRSMCKRGIERYRSEESRLGRMAVLVMGI